MFEISTEANFSAAHHLNNYEGPCENIHGHNWGVRAVVRCESLNDIGLGIDFKTLKKTLAAVLAEFDHADINMIFEPLGLNPSSENCAKYIFEKLEAALVNETCFVYRVEVTETQGNTAAFIR